MKYLIYRFVRMTQEFFVHKFSVFLQFHDDWPVFEHDSANIHAHEFSITAPFSVEFNIFVRYHFELPYRTFSLQHAKHHMNATVCIAKYSEYKTKLISFFISRVWHAFSLNFTLVTVSHARIAPVAGKYQIMQLFGYRLAVLFAATMENSFVAHKLRWNQ